MLTRDSKEKPLWMIKEGLTIQCSYQEIEEFANVFVCIWVNFKLVNDHYYL